MRERHWLRTMNPAELTLAHARINGSACSACGAFMSLLFATGCFPDPPRTAEGDVDTENGLGDTAIDVNEDDVGTATPETEVTSGETSEDVEITTPETGVGTLDGEISIPDTGTSEVVVTSCGEPRIDGDDCDDDDPCTVGERCSAGACVGGVPPDDRSGDWSIGLGVGVFIATSAVIDRAGTVVIAGVVDSMDASMATLTGAIRGSAESLDRVFAARISRAGEPILSAVLAEGTFGWGEAPFASARTFGDTLTYELTFTPRAGDLMLITGASPARNEALATSAVVQVRVQSDGTFGAVYRMVADGPGELQVIPTRRSRDASWLLLAMSARAVSLNGPDGVNEFVNPLWAEQSIARRMAAIRLSNLDQSSPIEAIFDLYDVTAIGVAPEPSLNGEGLRLIAGVRDEVEIETGSGPTTLEPFPGLRGLRMEKDGLLRLAGFGAAYPIVDQFELNDLGFDGLFQGFLPRVVPREDGGVFLVMRPSATRSFGSEVSSVVITPLHPTLVIASFELGGRLAWIRRIQVPSSTDVLDFVHLWTLLTLFVRADGSLVIGGGITRPLELESDDGVMVGLSPVDNSMDGFIAIWDRAGHLQLAENIARGAGKNFVSALAEDVDGSLVIAGYGDGETTLGVDGSAGSVSNPVGGIGFVARLNSAGGLDCRAR